MTNVFVLLTTLSVCAPAPVFREPPLEADSDHVQVIYGKRCTMAWFGDEANVAKVHFHFSADQGKTWRIAQSVSPKDAICDFEAPRPGIYWFECQVVFNNGTLEPAEIKGKTAVMKARVMAIDPRQITPTASGLPIQPAVPE